MRDLRRAGYAAVAVAVVLLLLRVFVYTATGSLAVLADAIEPLTNLLAAGVTLFSVVFARRPADADHPFGHRKSEFLAVGFQGAMVVLGAAMLSAAAWWQWRSGGALQANGPAVVVFLSSIVLSAELGRYLRRIGREQASPALLAAGRHAALDVYVGLGVLVNLVLVAYSGWWWLDLAFSLVMMVLILWGGFRLSRRAVKGLMDFAEPAVREQVEAVMATEQRAPVIGHHDVRCRDSGGVYYVDLHVQFQRGTSLETAHETGERIEGRIETALGLADATVHLEPFSELRPDRPPPRGPLSEREKLRRRAAVASLSFAVLITGLKVAAYLATHSAAVLSDALESIVNVVAAGFAVYSVRLARQAADAEHNYGHHKIEYLAAALEGALITLAAAWIIAAAMPRLIHGGELARLELGLLLLGIATLGNALLGAWLVRLGRRLNSLTLEADGRHVLSDVWTSVAVLLGLGVIRLTGWNRADAVVAMLAAVYILVTGLGLLRRSVVGVLDTVSPEVYERAAQVLEAGLSEGVIVGWHQLRIRDVEAFRFIDVHIQLPDGTGLSEAHDVAEQIEQTLESALTPAGAIVHAEPASEVRG